VKSYTKQIDRLSMITGQQVLLVTTTGYNTITGTMMVFEKTEGKYKWNKVFGPEKVNIGRTGFAEPGQKREGDGHTPSGVYPLGPVYGYLPTVDTKMPYTQSNTDDYWVDDKDSPQYNTWIRGKDKLDPNVKSYEKMVLSNDAYKYVIWIQYNTNPVVPGNGSAIFVHLWSEYGKPTAGCVSMSEKNMVKLLKWLDPTKKPVILLGTEEVVSNCLTQ